METSASNTENHWSQITITNVTIVKKFDILWELPKGDTDMEWANAVVKMVPVDFFDLLHELFIKNKTKKNHDLEIAIKQGMPVFLKKAIKKMIQKSKVRKRILFVICDDLLN